MEAQANSLTIKSSSPKVTIIIPAFNVPPEFMVESFHSIQNQTFRDFEALVVDESTNSECAAVCKALCNADSHFVYIRPSTRLGLAGSLNMALEYARGEFIARFDADDICMLDRLEEQVAFMEAHPDVDVLGGGLEIISEAGKFLAFRDYPVDHVAIERRFQISNSIAHPTVMVRKHVLDMYGAYTSSFRFAEDLELWLRLLNHGIRFANLPKVLVQYRQQNTRRDLRNWRFNLRARTRNFARRHLLRRVFGICAIALWGNVPGWVQECVFRGLFLRRN